MGTQEKERMVLGFRYKGSCHEKVQVDLVRNSTTTTDASVRLGVCQ